MVVKQQLPVATLVLVIGYVTNIISEFMTFSEKMSDFSSYSTAVDRVYKVVSYRSNHIAKFGEYDHDSINGKIELRNVSFSYDKKHRILKNIDVIVPPHSLTAIVGRSGSGKSTIFRLLTRLYKTKSGKILLDDVNIYEYKPKVYATNVSMITQSPFVFNMSIRENLALINPDHAAQVAACKKAGIHDFIVNLRDGYNTKLNGNSKLISDSKKQLIALARALLTKSEVLLFDEVTAATDAKTAEKITKIMEELKKDHTVLFITHDPTLMRKADRILVVDDGVIVAQGTHKALIKRSKFYRDLQNR
jgi:ATP-binding cassette subfamily B protein